ncbi:PREDICTED: heavy metal-associated isoprenylated plant protein 7-like [Ipomoea nil]|uniref:heavy metal-associated isoprenylated plant protein 7-like n=1 Tax=Ipomoea nil TaxID=35883 RepID=UPI000900F7A8|nr:PREDICTED: heavy metal-associated isoprenylated plant protein 7-like [Ipomoea nil]XP_019180366.1 PREDICTED: heavy metal-associated isoprenylated plant protein 7-like [Ipomoea nil]
MGKGKKGEEEQNPGGIIILGVYIHCKGCADTVRDSLIGFDGVEGIEVDESNHRATVKGKNADPIMVTERLRKKTGKYVELIFPIPKPKKEHKKEPKIQEPKVMEVILKVYMHCEACAKEVKHCLHKLPGVQIVDPDMESDTVRVKGTMSPESLVEFMSQRAGRHAQVLKVTKFVSHKKDNKDDGEKADSNKKGGAAAAVYKGYTHELLHAPQLFSDENPNACSIV